MIIIKFSFLIIFAIAGFGFFFSNREKFNYIKKYYFTTAYFYFVSFLVVFLFKNDLIILIKPFNPLPFVLLVCLYIFNIFIYFITIKTLQKPQFLKNYSNSHLQFLDMDFRYLLAKSGDILLQEVLMVTGIVLLSEIHLSLSQTTVFFVIIFTLLHLLYWYQITKKKHVPNSVARFFVIFPFLASLYIPSLVLRISYGFVYSYILHFLYYTLLALGLWIYY